ncbi:hypothetical protein M422DRAFT_36948, partial [Sphaerobolus stellatus SS14]
ADVEKSVQDELYKTLFAVDTHDFLDKIIPVASKDVRKIFAGLKKAKLHDSQNARWTNFLAEAIAIRPDGAFISKEIDPANLKKHNDRFEELEKALGGKRRTRSATKPPELEKNKLCCLWLLQIANVIEFKAKSGPDDVKKALLQLCGYARQILREQLDRRFVIAFTICFDKVDLYLFDRSGVVATNQSINIHTITRCLILSEPSLWYFQEPEKFIQTVACFSVLPTERLGHPLLHTYILQWVIQNPETSSEKFVSIRSLSLIGAEMMCGRAIIVLEVVTYEECAQVFVMKQSWQRLSGKNNDNTGQVIALENSSLHCDLPADLPSDGDSQDKPFDKMPYEVYAHSEVNLKDRIHYHQRFFLKGILHRDISGGNILILIPIDGHLRHSSFLLDLDHSKITKMFLPWKRTERFETAKFNAVKVYETAGDRTVHLATALYIWRPHCTSGDRTVHLATAVSGADCGEVSCYINAMAKNRGLEGIQQPISSEQLDWDDKTEDHCPWFSDHIPGSGLRTGTYPYMSHQIISGEAAHDAIHGIPVKDLTREWWELLKLDFAFKGHEYHNIHKRTLALLQATIEKIPDETGELTQQEDVRRVKYYTSTKDVIMTQQCVDSLSLTPKSNEKHNPRDFLSPGSSTPSGPNTPKRLRIECHRR